MAAVVLGAALGALAWDERVPAAVPTCEDSRVPVTLAPDDPTRWEVAVTLCGPRAEGATVHLLLAGASYGRAYWDFPYRPEVYSYVRALDAAGYATLNVDRIGLGESDHPPAEEVDIESNAYVTHQLVQRLRAGEIGGARYGRVVTVSHSLGVGIAWVEAATYHDVDGLIVTDGMHTPGSGLAVAVGSFYPAQLDARFATRNLPPGYLTTVPDRRGALFYHEPGAEPEVIARDEATKETATAAELATLALSADASVSRSINVPVLSVMGEFDRNFCDIPCSSPDSPAPAMEGQYYAPEACLEIFVVPDAGHDINLHRTAPRWYAAATTWTDRRVGRSVADVAGCDPLTAGGSAPSAAGPSAAGPSPPRPSAPATLPATGGNGPPAVGAALFVAAMAVAIATRRGTPRRP